MKLTYRSCPDTAATSDCKDIKYGTADYRPYTNITFCDKCSYDIYE